jgi:hypothetical protein
MHQPATVESSRKGEPAIERPRHALARQQLAALVENGFAFAEASRTRCSSARKSAMSFSQASRLAAKAGVEGGFDGCRPGTR